MALWPFIIVKHAGLKQDRILLNHERIHHRQQIELLLVGFYFLYLLHYCWNRLALRLCHHEAYNAIIFEKEAFRHEADLTYLQHRKPFNYVQRKRTHARPDHRN
jgi:hypothetical protein